MAANGTYLYGINDRGDTVGFYDDADGNYHGFLRDHRGRFTAIDAPGAELGTQPASINDRGEIVGAVVYADGSVPGRRFVTAFDAAADPAVGDSAAAAVWSGPWRGSAGTGTICSC